MLVFKGVGEKKETKSSPAQFKAKSKLLHCFHKDGKPWWIFFFFKIKVVLLQRASCLVILFPLGLTLYCSSFIFQCIKALSQAATRGSQEIAQGWPDKVKPIPAFTKSLLAGGSSSFRAVAFS